MAKKSVFFLVGAIFLICTCGCNKNQNSGFVFKRAPGAAATSTVEIPKNPGAPVAAAAKTAAPSPKAATQSVTVQAIPADTAGAPGTEPPKNDASIPEIPPQQLKSMIDGKNKIAIIDVRDPEETKVTPKMLEQAVNIPLKDLPMRMAEVPKDKGVVLVCRTGNRSMHAANFLKSKGYANLINLKGGMLGYDEMMKKLKEKKNE
ncbi:MAG TPA: rhodanese-like domain-containing protein [bacterium]|nr:rhodanese-like domain-containing protein [bacterium]